MLNLQEMLLNIMFVFVAMRIVATLVFVAAMEESMIQKTLHSFHDCHLVPPSTQVRRKLYVLMRPGIGWNTPSTVGDFAQRYRPALFSGRCGPLLDCSCMLMFRYIRSSSDNFRLWHRKAQWATNCACTQISISCWKGYLFASPLSSCMNCFTLNSELGLTACSLVHV